MSAISKVVSFVRFLKKVNHVVIQIVLFILVRPEFPVADSILKGPRDLVLKTKYNLERNTWSHVTIVRNNTVKKINLNKFTTALNLIK